MRASSLRSILVLSVVQLVLAIPASAAVESYTIEELPTLGGPESAALGINDLGEVVGYAELPGGEFRAVRWANGVLTDLGTLGGPFSIAYDINDAGRIVGQSESDVFPPGTRFAFYIDTGDPGQTALANLPYTYNAIARTVNASKQIAGVSLTIDLVDAVVWDAAGAVFKLPAFILPGQGEDQGDVWDSNDANDLVGWSMFIDPGSGFIGRRAALWPTGDPGGAIVDLGTLGGNGSEARGINNAGQIVGYAAVDSPATTHAFLWSGGSMTDLGDLSATGDVVSWAQDINDAAVVVGFSQVSTGSNFEAFVWDGDEMRNLNDLIPPGTGWLLRRAHAINAVGQIVGEGIAPGGEVRGFVLTPACGSGVCDPDEDCFTCPADCLIGAGAESGNGTCEAGDGEDCLSCPLDCNGKQSGNPNKRFCCGDGDGQNPVDCSDARCSAGGLTCTDQPDPGTCCGDSVCEGPEDSTNCSNDCGAPPFCGDDTCDAGEDPCTCPADCGVPPVSETSCTNGVDDDCDGFLDCDDEDCDGDPACTCLPKNATCTLDTECCSGNCKANGRCR
jgi:probable HAF family extracellular repeat protein